MPCDKPLSPSGRQEVRATVRITFDVDRGLDADHLRAAIQEELHAQLLDTYGGNYEGSPAEAVVIEILDIKEEAEIYGNE